jgi:hypothetical protein
VQNGTPLSEFVRVRDDAAEQRRDRNLPENREPGPRIFTYEAQSLRLISGAALAHTGTGCRNCIVRLESAIADVERMAPWSNNFADRALLDAVRMTDAAPAADSILLHREGRIEHACRHPQISGGARLVGNRHDHLGGSRRSARLK